MAQPRSKPTIHDVAAAAQVSVPTVSRVLNGRYGVAEKTAKRVRRAIDELGYESSLAARGMRSAKTNVIGLIVPDMDHSYALEVIKGVSRALSDTHYDLFAMTSGNKTLAERSTWELQQVARLNGTIADGIILVVPNTDNFRTDYPLVAIDPYYKPASLPTVVADNREGAFAAVHYLSALGHKRIGFVSGFGYLQSEARQQGYEDALAKLGLPPDPDLIAQGDFRRKGGYAAGRRLLSLHPPPTAVFAANDETALGVMDAAQEANLSIPADLSVIGFDDIPDARLNTPPLTTIRQPVAKMGEAALEMVMKLIDGEPLSNQTVTVPTKLIVRSSCAPPPDFKNH